MIDRIFGTGSEKTVKSRRTANRRSVTSRAAISSLFVLCGRWTVRTGDMHAATIK